MLVLMERPPGNLAEACVDLARSELLLKKQLEHMRLKLAEYEAAEAVSRER